MSEHEEIHQPEVTVDEAASEQGQAEGEAVLGHQIETLKQLSLIMRNKIHGASYEKRARELRQLDEAMKEADQSWDAVEGEAESEQLPAAVWERVQAGTKQLQNIMAALLEEWRHMGQGHARHGWWRDIRREHEQLLSAAVLAVGLKKRRSVWDRSRGRAPPQQWTGLRRKARAEVATIMDGLGARTSTHSITMLYDECTSKFETACTKGLAGYFKAVCTAESLHAYATLQRSLQRARELQQVHEYYFDALHLSDQRHLNRILAGLLTTEGTRRQDNPFKAGACNGCIMERL
jgi:flagellin-specific chaperone FliS